jgi:Saxitoxin biosynthesis operon protein SxtJ
VRTNASHENFARDDKVERPPDRQFGLVFASVFAIVAAWPAISGRPVRWWSAVLAAAFLAAALVAPRALAPLNRVWLWIGLLLHTCVSPIALGLVFFSTVTPLGLLLRAMGKDPLRLRFDSQARTYWIERRPPGPAGNSMPNQF